MSSGSQGARILRFDSFQVDLAAGELFRNGARLHLEAQPFRLLAMLLQRPGEVITHEEIRKSLWPDTPFVDFDNGLHTAIRKIRRALNDSASNPRFIETLPRKGYRFTAPVNTDSALSPPIGWRGLPPAVRWSLLTLVIVAAVLTGWAVTRTGEPAGADLSPVPLTSDPGLEISPTFSPEGTQVAYAGDQDGSFDIYVKQIGPGQAIQLTSGPAADYCPSWSPDGKFIAFLRDAEGDETGLWIVPALRGTPRRLTKLNPDEVLFCSRPSWSPDSQWLAVAESTSAGYSQCFLVSAASGERRPIPRLADGASECSSPVFHPDGEKILFAREGQFYSTSLTETATTSPERLTDSGANYLLTLAAAPNGRDLVFNVGVKQYYTLWKLPLSAPETGGRLALPGNSLVHPAFSPNGRRFAYTKLSMDVTIRKAAIAAPGEQPPPPVDFAPSTVVEYDPRWSPDGGRVAFKSHRSGAGEIWLFDWDTSSMRQLTFFEKNSGWPGWSPDGKSIVFHMAEPGVSVDLYVVSAEGGEPRRLTTDPSEDAMPSYSHDGKWIYFGSARSGKWEIWKMPINGGEPRRVTQQGGYSGFESPDGRFVYYCKRGKSTLWKVPADGGEEIEVMNDQFFNQNFTVSRQGGIYYVRDRDFTIQMFDPETGATRQIAEIGRRACSGMTTSPDEKWLLYTHTTALEADLMLVENFHW